MLELSRSVIIDDIVGRTLEGVALTYGRTYRVSDDGGQTHYREGWTSGAFTDTIRNGHNTFEFRRLHNPDHRIGMTQFEDTAERLSFRATLDEGDEGDEALSNVHAGVWRSVSLAFRPRRQERDPGSGVMWRQRADIRELSLTPIPQYHDAEVIAVRSKAALATIDEILLSSATLLDYARTV